jgi:3-(3-hydroxy-phenyl)propionate hydroxylase
MYIVTMRFKPMPVMKDGALTRFGSVSEPDVVGRLFPQPNVVTRQAGNVKMDDATGPWFTLLVWNNNPKAILDDDAQRRLARNGVRLVAVRPAVQLNWAEPTGEADDVLIVGDAEGALKRWFEAHPESVVLLRPDRIVAGACQAHNASDMIRAFDGVIGAAQ